MLDDVLYALLLLIDRNWRDSPRRARRLARRYEQGQPVTVPAWVGDAVDETSMPGRVRLMEKSAAAEWRPLDKKRQARNLTLLTALGPATIRDGKPGGRPFAHAWSVRDADGSPAFMLLARPYGAAFAPLLAADGDNPAHPSSTPSAEPD